MKVGTEGGGGVWAGKSHSPLTIQSVAMSRSCLTRTVQAIWTQRALLRLQRLGALIVSGRERCSRFDSLLPNYWDSLEVFVGGAVYFNGMHGGK